MTRDQVRFLARLLVRIAALVVMVLAAGQLADVVKRSLDFEIKPHTEDTVHRAIMIGTVVYIALTAIPFVPGAEIGMTMLGVFGAAIAPLVFGATIISLMLAFFVGRLIPADRTAFWLRRAGLRRTADLIADMAVLPQKDRLAHLLGQVEQPFVLFLSKYRFVALALIINLPGNVIIGGGGGIAMVAGLSRVFGPLGFFLTVAIAVSPVPLSIMFFGR